MTINPLKNLNFDPLAALNSDEKNTANLSEFAFPRDELLAIDHWVTFTAFRTRQFSRRDYAQAEQQHTIILPLPANLGSEYNIEYAEPSLGAIGKTIVDAFGSGENGEQIRQILERAGATGVVGGVVGGAASGLNGGSPGDILGAAATSAVTAAVVGAAATDPQRFGATVANEATNSTLGAAIAGQAGVARNPHKVVLFEQVGFRNHRFSYQFTPKSYEEAVQLREIVKLFKYYGSPSYDANFNLDLSAFSSIPGASNVIGDGRLNIDASAGRHFFRYPEYFKIEFHHPAFLYTIGPSVITGIDVQFYPGTGVPSFARSKGREPTPTQINLTVQFKETELVTKENVRLGR